ncbi:MAG: transposase [Candidatus Dormibacteraeota bacterium]|uniref:Transposase n=1 Tax=Candidatus Amunia macphersoniae TaxID=3127014 RepID=A0A934KQT2_9BACT|nr:transposase [Candidatus Dormibacteraeota bacterium]
MRAYPRQLLHVVVDNASSHKTPDVQQWLRRHRRVHLHFTPTGSSWLNQVETWFSILSRRAIRRGVFRSLSTLIAAIQRCSWTAGTTAASHSSWVKSAEQILAELTVNVPMRRSTSPDLSRVI